MNMIKCLMVIVALMVMTSITATEWSMPETYVKSGVITNLETKMGHERGEHATFIDLDGASRWEIENFDAAPDLNWQIGDKIKIFFEPDSHYHSAENLDKQNQTFLILIRP